MNKYTPLSENTKAIILGSVLGDGSLKLHPGYANARFSFRHSEKQSDYFWWKANRLKEISGEKFAWHQNKDGKDGWGTAKYRFCSQALPALTEMLKLVQPKNKFEIRRKWLNLLTPLSLAIWWQDDGSIIANGRKGVLCTDGFTKPEVQLLQRYLEIVWHVHTVVGPKNKANSQFRLWFRSTEQLQSFLRIILPYIAVEQMIPKFILLYHNRQLQQRWISEVVAISGFSQEIVEKYYHLKRNKWKNYSGSDSENDIVQSI